MLLFVKKRIFSFSCPVSQPYSGKIISKKTIEGEVILIVSGAKITSI
jgi:hypothetical protein